MSIGFNQTIYTISEDEPTGRVDLVVSVISGILRTPVEVTVTTGDNTALGL